MRIGFISNKLTLRGTEVNLYDYAHYNEKLLGNSSVIITRSYETAMRCSPRDVHPEAYKKFSSRFDVMYYENPHDIPEIVKCCGIDVLFIEKAGSPSDGLVFDCCPTIIHSVFTLSEPHGTLYSAISHSLNTLHKTNYPVLPYMINIHDSTENMRAELGIPADATVFGSMSGADEFTIDYVRRVVENVVNDPTRGNIYFVFLNIDRFGPPSDRLKFLPGTADMLTKRRFINTCDGMLYGRAGGETFGLACGEFSVAGKPVIGRAGEHGNSHEQILGDAMIKHTNYEECYDIVTNWDAHKKDVSNNGYFEYTPPKVMKNFEKHLCALRIPPRRQPILFVTAFRDINRHTWSVIPRTVEVYNEQFLNLARNIDYKLLVFASALHIKQLAGFDLPRNIEFIDINTVETFYDRFLERESRMIASPEFQTKVPADRKDCPEHWNAAYNLVNHSKINFIAAAKRLAPDYEFYSWLDFGCIRNTIADVPKYIDFSRLEKGKMLYLGLKALPTHRRSASEMVASHDVYFAGSQFVIHTSIVTIMENLWENKLADWSHEIICDEDQGLILQIYFDHPELFQVHYNPKWFTLFSSYLNSNKQLDSKLALTQFLKLHGLTGTFAEIGVARGHFSDLLLRNTDCSHLLLIDPYKNFEKEVYRDGMNFYDMNAELEFTKARFAAEERSGRVGFLRKMSDDAAAIIADESLDFVYIDGNHSYEFALKDIKNYWKKVRKGGILAGDDVYELAVDGCKEVLKIWDGAPSIHSSKSFGVYGVHNAVFDFCAEHKLKFTIFDNQFIIFKV
jgi:hypothetical protein